MAISGFSSVSFAGYLLILVVQLILYASRVILSQFSDQECIKSSLVYVFALEFQIAKILKSSTCPNANDCMKSSLFVTFPFLFIFLGKCVREKSFNLLSDQLLKYPEKIKSLGLKKHLN